MKKNIILLFTILLLVSSCEKDKPQTLVLHTPQQVDNTIVLNWEQANISGFEYYMVMRSSDRKRYDIINDIVTPTSDAFRKEITTFEDCTYPLNVDTLYYKIMAVGKETRSSQGLCYRIERPVRLVKGNNIQNVHYVDETNKLSVLLYDYSTGYRHILNNFDLETGQFSSNAVSVNLSYSTSWYFWGKCNGKTEFYNYNDGYIYVYDASTVQQVASLQTPFIWYAPYTTNNKGIIYIYRDNYLYLINRITGEYTQYQSTNYISANNLYYDSENNKLYAVGYDGRIQTFILDNDGNVTGEEMYSSGYSYYNLLYIENSSLFVVRTNSDIKILDMNTKTFHNTDLTQMPNVILLNNNVLYASNNSSNSIYQLSVENYTFIKSTPVRVVPMKFFINNGYLYFWGQYSSYSYILDKIKI